VRQFKAHLKQVIAKYLEKLQDNVGRKGLVWQSGLERSKAEGNKK
jgi:hypothetical protein